jgi:3-deoxy-manno-octulosonate cytidylyltransferase (CMP-KDO synthetase)
MKVAIIIPARLKSTRFPAKPLAKICGKEMILHVCDNLKGLDADIIVATDDESIKKVVEDAGYKAVITEECRTGTDRVYLATEQLDSYDFYVNVQGDEPLVNIDDVNKVIIEKTNNMDYIIATKSKLKDGEMDNVNVVKVSDDGTLTRKPIETKFRQQGIYAFTLGELYKFHYLETIETESIELTRLPESDIKFIEIKGSHAVDLPSDIQIVEKIIKGC